MGKLNWKKIAVTAFWLFAGCGTIVLLGAAMQKKSQKKCLDIKIEITGVSRQLFIDENDVLEILQAFHPIKGISLSSLNLRSLESIVEKNPWVSNAEMFVDNNQILQVRIEERQPVARVFTLEGSSFYLDSGGARLPLSDKLSARVPIFTGFPSDKDILAGPDSLLLNQIVQMGQYIMADSFWMAQVAQIDITPQSGFEMIPVIGDQVIELGNAEGLDSKFRRLYIFYQQAWLQNGINTYEKLDVQYDNQVVAVKRGTAKTAIDSAKALQMVQDILAKGLVDSNSKSEIAAFRKETLLKSVMDSVIKGKLSAPVNGLPEAPPGKLNSAGITNNKTTVKALSKGAKLPDKEKKAKTGKPLEKVGQQPKAVMGKSI